jgi:GT2 family glycosyltransferase
MDASVVIALNPHENDFERVLDAYVLQTASAASFEVIVVNAGARADMDAKLRRASRRISVRMIDIERQGRAAANNAGAGAARSDLILFMADDFIPCTTLVRAHIEFHRHAKARAVGIGPAFFADWLREDPFRRWLEDSGLLFGTALRMAGSNWPQGFFYVGNASMRRSLFEELGRFDEAFDHDLTDDFEFCLRLRRSGVRTHCLPKARACHDHEVTLAERVEALRRCGEAARHVSALHGRIAQWSILCEQPLDDVVLAARRAEEQDALASTPETRAARFHSSLNLGFAQGFHAAPLQATAAAKPAGQPSRRA